MSLFVSNFDLIFILWLTAAMNFILRVIHYWCNSVDYSFHGLFHIVFVLCCKNQHFMMILTEVNQCIVFTPPPHASDEHKKAREKQGIFFVRLPDCIYCTDILIRREEGYTSNVKHVGAISGRKKCSFCNLPSINIRDHRLTLEKRRNISERVLNILFHFLDLPQNTKKT